MGKGWLKLKCHMSAALGLLLIAQLSSFEFTGVTSPQTAGDSFSITIVAKDPYGGVYPYNGNALLSTTRDGLWSYVYPSLIGFRNGVWQGNVMVTLAESLALRCTEPAHQITGHSDTIEVLNGPPARFLTILPGEEMAPGSPVGRMPRPPDNQVAGDTFTIATYLTDAWFNVVEFRNDSVYFSATDSFAQLPNGGLLINGHGTFPVSLRQAGRQRIATRAAASQPFRPDTSTQFEVIPGPFAELLLLLPGEAILPGDTCQEAWQTPGKSGTPTPQFVREPFAISVYPCDNCWNVVSGPGDRIALRSDFSFTATPAETTISDVANFTVQFNSSGPNQNIWVTELSGGHQSYKCWLDIKSRGRILEITAPDTVRAGETTNIHVVVKDANEWPITAAVCRFAVIKGHGDMLDQALLTDTLGIVNARFLCTRARFAEHDTIRISAGAVDSFIGIYVNIPDSAVMKGQIVAFPNPFGPTVNQDAAEIYYYLPRSSPVTVTIYDPFGNEVYAWSFKPGEPGARSGVNQVIWNGRNRQGRRVASGVYLIQVLGELHTGTTFRATYRLGVVW